jgi:hypothetical protein
MRTVGLLALLLLTPLAGAAAQDVPLQPGRRVRVTVPSAAVSGQQATFQRVSGDTLVLSSASYAVNDVTRLDVSTGRHGHPWTGMLIGLLGGAAAGAGIAAAAYDSNEDFYALVVLVGAGIGAGSGLLVGAVAGALIKTERWEEISLDRVLVSLMPTHEGRLAIRLSMTF